METTTNVKGWYGFVGLGQMGGNAAKSIHVREYPVMAANMLQSDLDGLDIPEGCKYHILGGYGSSKERKKAKQLLAENNCENFDLLINEIKERFKECHVVFLMGSSGGGSGSAIVPATKKRLQAETDKIICVVFQVVDFTKSADGDRWLPLTDRAKKLIKRVERINEAYGHRYQDFLFVKDGRCLTADAIDAQIKRGCEHIGIPVKTMHKIRKTYASILLHNGVNLSIVKDILGHADESTTLKHYIYNIENSTETDNKVLNAIDQKNDARSDQNIISFAKIKRTENPDKSTFSAL